MKIMKKLQNRKEELKKNNKGFSLVELIIVIAIMAILVGVVGTQVIPYINKSKESKDFQIVSSYGTAAMTAYSANAANVTIPASNKIEFTVYGTNAADPEKLLSTQIQNLTYTAIPSTKFKSTEGKKINDIKVTYDFGANTITTQAVDSSGADVLDAVVSDM